MLRVDYIFNKMIESISAATVDFEHITLNEKDLSKKE